ncbi:hypothetical protein ACP70R_009494 [Stipagrostis hirtigluma subsp. patula]
MPPPAPPAAVLMDEIMEDVLHRLPPDDPASLARATLVCRPWWRLVSDAGFRRRYRDRHRTAPMLGFLRSSTDAGDVGAARFVPTSSFRPPRGDRAGLRALDSRHGRVLLRTTPWRGEPSKDALLVWDPVTDEERELPALPCYPHPSASNWNAAVVCAAAAAACDGGCSHLDCHRDPFLVVFAGFRDFKAFACVYSSEAAAWSEPTYCGCMHHQFDVSPSVHVGNALYFMLHSSSCVLQYDLITRRLSVFLLPYILYQSSNVLMTTEGGGLGFASMADSRLFLGSRVAGPDGGASWVVSRVIELNTMVSIDALLPPPRVVGFAEGVGVIFKMGDGLFTIDRQYNQVTKVGDVSGICEIVPYVSFCLPESPATSMMEVVLALESRALGNGVGV